MSHLVVNINGTEFQIDLTGVNTVALVNLKLKEAGVYPTIRVLTNEERELAQQAYEERVAEQQKELRAWFAALPKEEQESLMKMLLPAGTAPSDIPPELLQTMYSISQPDCDD